jgi:hypothetical protein
MYQLDVIYVFYTLQLRATTVVQHHVASVECRIGTHGYTSTHRSGATPNMFRLKRDLTGNKN